VCAQTKVVPFTGEKTTWRGGYDRYDFLMDRAWKILLPFSLFFLVLFCE